jgi:hypothetical protein
MLLVSWRGRGYWSLECILYLEVFEGYLLLVEWACMMIECLERVVLDSRYGCLFEIGMVC